MQGTEPRGFENNPILKDAAAFILQRYGEQKHLQLVFHNYHLTQSVVQEARQVLQDEYASDELSEVVLISAWFLNIGFPFDYRHPLQNCLKELTTFFGQQHYPEAKRRRVVQAIQTVANNQLPVTDEEKILSDAWNIAAYLQEFETRMALLRLEWEMTDFRHPDKTEWLNWQLERVLQIQLFTHSARARWEKDRGKAILGIKEAINKQKGKEQTSTETEHYFQGLEKKIPVRAAQTFFRTNFRNHINLSSIADNKANIMISVNSILISVLITFLSYRNIGENNPMILLPVVIFLVTGLASLIFAVLSARPKVTTLNQGKTAMPEIRKNLAFFGNFVQLSVEEYEKAMDDIFQDSELLYGNMVRDLYYLGKVLDKKYRYLTVSYNIFMVGFVATVGSFLFALFG